MKRSTILFFVITFSVIATSAQESGPVAISPSSDEGIARVSMSCPTFSWTGMEWATAYKLAVFESNGPNVLAYNEMESIASPILNKEIQGRALSWTPASDERLRVGSMYVWYIQAIDVNGQGLWSKGSVFKVDIPLSFKGLEENVRERLEEQGLSEDVIEEMLRDMRSGIRDAIVWGVDPTGIDEISPKEINIQGNEVGSNTYYGENAGASLTLGTQNTFIGYQAGRYNEVGLNNTFVGCLAGVNTTASHNTFLGRSTGEMNTTGDSNTFLGHSAGYHNSIGQNGTFVGRAAGYNNDDGNYNTFIGYFSGTNNIEGSDNTFVGHNAGHDNTWGSFNVYLGHNAGYKAISHYNTFIGHEAGYENMRGYSNIFVGYQAGRSNSTGYRNVFIGSNAGGENTTGNNNVFLGANAGQNETGSDKLYIDNWATSSPLIWGDFENDILTVHGKLGIGTKSPAYTMELETTGENSILLLDRTDGAKTGFSASGDKAAWGTLSNHPLWLVIDGAFQAIFHTDGSLQMMNGAWCTAAGEWQDASSRELKENIRSLTVEEAKQALEGLDPVRFNYKADKDDENLGFIAEDVPEIVASKGRKSMSAMDVVAVLTKVVQDQQRAISELKIQIDELKGKEK